MFLRSIRIALNPAATELEEIFCLKWAIHCLILVATRAWKAVSRGQSTQVRATENVFGRTSTAAM